MNGRRPGARRASVILRTLLLTACLAGCASRPFDADERLSIHGLAVAAHPDAARAGAEILEAGGNAADAAVATGFAVSVLEPSMNSLGGRALALARTGSGELHGYDGMTQVPGGYRRPAEPVADGYQVIATPGLVAALAQLHEDLGSLPWKSLLQPAIRLAEDGFLLPAGEAGRLSETLAKFPNRSGLQAHFAGAGRDGFRAGERLRQPQLAATLRILAEEGADAFYRGRLAELMAADMAANGGFLTREDLAGYEVRPGRELVGSYRGHDIHALAAPGGGGLVIKALHILENFPLAELDEAAWAAVVNQALAISFNSMHEDYAEADPARVVDKDWARRKAAEIRLPGAGGRRYDGADAADYEGGGPAPEIGHTTHFVTGDCHGMTLSMTQTVGPVLGSKVVTPGLGFVYATTMGTYLAAADETPGARPRTTISPTLVTRNGELLFALGAAGGLRIASGLVQTISRHLDQGLPLAEAVAAPRIHPERILRNGRRTARPCCFHAETTRDGWRPEALAFWQAAGFTASGDARVGAFARIHAAGRRDDAWYGVADPDWQGATVHATASACHNRK